MKLPTIIVLLDFLLAALLAAVVIGAFTFFGGCSNVPINKEVSVFYERDLRICVNGTCASGIIAVNRAPEYKIEINSTGRSDYLQIKTCNRHIKFEKQGRKFRYNYRPLKGIEDQPNCSIEISSFDKRKSKHNAWGFIVIEDSSRYSVQANLKCNGSNKWTDPKGTSICQSKAGLKQRIIFKNEMFVAACSLGSERCPELKTRDNKSFDFNTPPRHCCYVFLELAENKNGKHLLHTIGYEETSVRQ